jgi:hypothetical protein
MCASLSRHFKRNFLFLCFTFFLVLTAHAQPDSVYQILLAKAGLFHLQKDHKSAVSLYAKAFQIKQPDALTAYKAAGMYALEGNAEQAFRYLQLALSSGFTEADWLFFDPYFDYLRQAHHDKWKAIEAEAFQKEQEYMQTLTLPSLRKEINLMTLNDQKLRYKKVQSSNDSVRGIINQQINKSDLQNLHRAKEIIGQYGWLKMSEIGKDGQNNLWLIIQHADGDVLFQQSALRAMEKLKGTKEINMENYAFLYDRVQCNLNYRQLYGTQVLWTRTGEASAFRPLITEYKADKRREKIGLQPLRIYALTYGFTYHKVTAKQSKQNDINYQAHVSLLMDSANQFYRKKEYQKTYDYYNTASTFLGGMSNSDNLEAAVIFSNIAAVNNEARYKSMALDFLDLLCLRGRLTKKKLSQQPVFSILYKEPRWKEMSKRVK